MAEVQKAIALIVGAASPIGALAAEAVGEQGYLVGLCDLASEACTRIQQQLEAKGIIAESHPADPSKKLSFQTMLEHFLERHGCIDLLVNASMVAPQRTLLDMDEWDWRRAMDLNLSTVFISIQSVGRVFRDLGGGTILNLVEQEADPQSFTYQSSAAAILALSESARAEIESIGVGMEGLAVPRDKQKLAAALAPYLALQAPQN